MYTEFATGGIGDGSSTKIAEAQPKATVRLLAVLLVSSLFLAACGTSVESDESLEPLATVTVEAYDADGDSWQGLDGITVEGPLELRLDVNGNADALLVSLDGAGTVSELEAEPYTFTLESELLEVGSQTLRVERYQGKGSRTKEVARADFEVVDTTDDETTDGTSDDGTANDEDTTDDETIDETSSEETTDDDTTDGETWSSPIIITEGGTYSGRWESLDSSTPAVTVATSEPVVIEDASIRSAGHLIHAPWTSADLTIRNVAGEALYPSEAGRPAGRFLQVEGYRHVTVENSYLERTSGIYLNASEVGATVRIVGNRAHDIDGRRADGAGGYDGVAYVQFVQLNNGQELSGSEISWNEVINRPYESRVEDVISLYATSGRSDDPVRVHNNYIEGAFAEDPASDSFSGGGIMLGDGGGSFLHAYENRVVATSNYGVAISGGHENRIDNNVVVSCGELSDGTLIAAQNVGMYVWNMDDETSFGDNGGSGNQAAWAHPEHDRNDWWTPDASVWTDNESLYEGSSVSCSYEDDTYAAWLNEVEQVEASVGLVSSN